MNEILIGQDATDPNNITVLPQAAEEKAKQLPQPSGYRILCAIPEVEEKFESGIVNSMAKVGWYWFLHLF